MSAKNVHLRMYVNRLLKMKSGLVLLSSIVLWIVLIIMRIDDKN